MFARRKLGEAMEESHFALGHGAGFGGTGEVAVGAGGAFVVLELLQFRGDGFFLWLAGAVGEGFIPAGKLPARACGEFGGSERLMRPRAEGRAGNDGSREDEACAGGGQRGECGEGGVTEFAAVAVSDGGVADVAFARAEFARSALQNTHGAPVACSTTSRIAPGKSGLMRVLSQASVVGWQA